jgi:hypothetical protein
MTVIKFESVTPQTARQPVFTEQLPGPGLAVDSAADGGCRHRPLEATPSQLKKLFFCGLSCFV